jgi:hypothetical protein
MYLFWKLSALIIVTIISPNNCLFRSLSRGPLAIAQASFLLAAMLLFFVLQCVWAPCINVVSNANEFTSRLNYVLTALISLLVVLDVPGKDIINGVVLYMSVRYIFHICCLSKTHPFQCIYRNIRPQLLYGLCSDVLLLKILITMISQIFQSSIRILCVDL